MKKGSILFLKLAIYIIGIVVLALYILFTIAVMNDGGGLFTPILFIIYVTAIPFFFGLYNALNLLSYIEKGKAFSKLSIKALKSIKYCAIIIGALYVIGLPFIIQIAEIDDAPGAAAIGFFIIIASIVIAILAAVFQKRVQKRIR